MNQAPLSPDEKDALDSVFKDVPREHLSPREVDELYSEGRIDPPRQANYHDL